MVTGFKKIETVGNNPLDTFCRLLARLIRFQIADVKAQEFIPRVALHTAIRFIGLNNSASGINHPESISSGLYDGLQVLLAVCWHPVSACFICQIITAIIGV